MMTRFVVLGACMLALRGTAQTTTSAMVPGIPPDEYVDVTGDGRADLLITSRTIPISDPQQPGYLGQYKVGVRTLAGTAVLMWSTPSNQRWFTLDSAARLDTSELAARIHFKQLSWTDADQATEFWLLERPFGPAITKDQDGWYGTGDHHDGRTMVLRSANDRGTGVAAFSFELPFPYGRVVVKKKEAIAVPNGFGEEGDPVSMKPLVKDEYDFGHEENEPQVLVPPGVPPDELVDLNGDEVPDVVITGHVEHVHGAGEPGIFVRGISPLPGTAFLLTKERWGVEGPFRLGMEEALSPERLHNGLRAGLYRWAAVDDARVFHEVLRYPTGLPDQPAEWTATDPDPSCCLVYRTTAYGRAVIGVIELQYSLPGGELGVRPQNWVEEGQVLQVR